MMGSRTRIILKSLGAAAVLSAFLVALTFVIAPSTTIVKTFLSVATVTLVFPAAYVSGKRSVEQAVAGRISSGGEFGRKPQTPSQGSPQGGSAKLREDEAKK